MSPAATIEMDARDGVALGVGAEVGVGPAVAQAAIRLKHDRPIKRGRRAEPCHDTIRYQHP